MTHRFKIKRPSGIKEWTGWSIKTIVSPTIGAVISYMMMQQVKWLLILRILVGMFILFPWFWIVSRWLLVPIWNSLYTPSPDVPTDEGIIESNIYKNSNGNLYLLGHCFDIIRYTGIPNNEKLCLERMSSDEEASLEKTDTTVKLHYKFIKYRNGIVRASYYRNPPRMKYNWPVYEYTALD